jgi:hypothetical protein
MGFFRPFPRPFPYRPYRPCPSRGWQPYGPGPSWNQGWHW